MNQKISIITVCLNSIKTIEKTINSVINQNNPNFEYIIIDGGSDDGTLAVIKRYRQHIACFISEQDSGVYDAMNKGIRAASGDVIAFLNSDDWYPEDTVDMVLKEFDEADCDIVYGNRYLVEKEGAFVTLNQIELDIDELRFEMILYHQAVFAKARIFNQIGSFDTKFKVAADYDWLLKAYNNGMSFRYLKRPLVYFSYGGISKTEVFQGVGEMKNIALGYLSNSEKEKALSVIDERCKEIIRYHTLKGMDELAGSDASGLGDIFSKYISLSEKVYVWGSGQMGVRCLSYLQALGVSIKAIVDSNAAKWNQKINGIEIKDIQVLREEEYKIIITPAKSGDEIENKLEEWGYQKHKDYVLFSELIDHATKHVLGRE